MSECLADALLEPLIPKWQKIADLLAELLAVPAVLIMRADADQLEVFVASASAQNLYPAGVKGPQAGLYCETVIQTQQKLLIPDATRDPHWDKNPDLKLGMIAYLGYEVVSCVDGVEAVAYYRAHWQEIALVILDVVMPRMGGREALDALRTINPAVKVLVSSGYSIDGEARELLENGAQAFLQKPFSRADLSQKVAELLR